MMREEELFLQDGHAEQHMLHAALPQHIANCDAPHTPSTAPILYCHQRLETASEHFFQISYISE